MTSRNRQEKRYVPRPPSVSSHDDVESSDVGATPAARRREFNVYDAVAGRVSSRKDASVFKARPTEAGPGQGEPRAKKHSTRNTTLAPEEVLFRRQAAPLRWPDHDVYMAHERDLRNGGHGVLPSSDLLKAIHFYSSHFYDALGQGGRRKSHFVGRRNINERSMDETALLGLGILLEEAAREVLGRNGDLVFTEGEPLVGQPCSEPTLNLDTVDETKPLNTQLVEASDGPVERRKRRKMENPAEA